VDVGLDKMRRAGALGVTLSLVVVTVRRACDITMGVVFGARAVAAIASTALDDVIGIVDVWYAASTACT
jgi:hypothetical protein